MLEARTAATSAAWRSPSSPASAAPRTTRRRSPPPSRTGVEPGAASLPDVGFVRPAPSSCPSSSCSDIGAMPLWAVEYGRAPTVNVRMVFTHGSAYDPQGREGVAGFTFDMLNEGTEARDAFALSERLHRLRSADGLLLRLHAGLLVDLDQRNLAEQGRREPRPDAGGAHPADLPRGRTSSASARTGTWRSVAQAGLHPGSIGRPAPGPHHLRPTTATWAAPARARPRASPRSPATTC